MIKLKNKLTFFVLNTKYDFLEYKKYFNDPIDYPKISPPCGVGFKNFSIDSDGNVRLCFTFPPIGNILESDPDKIWKSLEAKRQRNIINSCKKTCKLLLCNRRKSLRENLPRFLSFWKY